MGDLTKHDQSLNEIYMHGVVNGFSKEPLSEQKTVCLPCLTLNVAFQPRSSRDLKTKMEQCKKLSFPQLQKGKSSDTKSTDGCQTFSWFLFCLYCITLLHINQRKMFLREMGFSFAGLWKAFAWKPVSGASPYWTQNGPKTSQNHKFPKEWIFFFYWWSVQECLWREVGWKQGKSQAKDPGQGWSETEKPTEKEPWRGECCAKGDRQKTQKMNHSCSLAWIGFLSLNRLLMAVQIL